MIDLHDAVDFDCAPYRHTHVSREDGSPAMMVSEQDGQIVLVNEDGYKWSDPAEDWLPIESAR